MIVAHPLIRRPHASRFRNDNPAHMVPIARWRHILRAHHGIQPPFVVVRVLRLRHAARHRGHLDRIAHDGISVCHRFPARHLGAHRHLPRRRGIAAVSVRPWHLPHRRRHSTPATRGPLPANCLSLALGVLICFDLLVFPAIVASVHNDAVNWVFGVLSACIVLLRRPARHLLPLLRAQSHPFRQSEEHRTDCRARFRALRRDGPPLLQKRIAKGIEIQRQDPHARLILSGGQAQAKTFPKAWQ